MDYENPKTIDYTVHESIMARMERANKRWFIAWLVTFLLLCACVGGFIWYEAQFEDTVITAEQTADDRSDEVSKTKREAGRLRPVSLISLAFFH